MKKLPLFLSVLALILAAVPNVRHHYDKQCQMYLGFSGAAFKTSGVGCKSPVGLTVPLKTLRERYNDDCKNPVCRTPLRYEQKNASSDSTTRYAL